MNGHDTEECVSDYKPNSQNSEVINIERASMDSTSRNYHRSEKVSDINSDSSPEDNQRKTIDRSCKTKRNSEESVKSEKNSSFYTKN